MLDNLRPLLTRILEPLAKRLNINPNIVTVISPFLALHPAQRIFRCRRWCCRQISQQSKQIRRIS